MSEGWCLETVQVMKVLGEVLVEGAWFNSGDNWLL